MSDTHQVQQTEETVFVVLSVEHRTKPQIVILFTVVRVCLSKFICVWPKVPIPSSELSWVGYLCAGYWLDAQTGCFFDRPQITDGGVDKQLLWVCTKVPCSCLACRPLRGRCVWAAGPELCERGVGWPGGAASFPPSLSAASWRAWTAAASGSARSPATHQQGQRWWWGS